MKLLRKLLSIPKTVYFNFKMFPFMTAIKLPVFVAHDIKLIYCKRGSIILKSKPKRFMIRLGFGGTNIIPHRKGILCLDGAITFEGDADLSEGIVICSTGDLYIGNHIFANNNCTIWCNDSIHIGTDSLLGWNVFIRDSDGHKTFYNNKETAKTKPIYIDDHCWLCSESHVLKGAGLGKDCILAYHSILTRKYVEANTLFVGTPALPKKSDMNWKR